MTRYELPAVVVEHRLRATNQYELILHAPPIAERATPGQFVMLRPLRTHAPLWRRPYSILRANPDKGVFSVFYSVQSAFTELLSLKPIGSTVQTLGPLGSYFVPVRAARRHILVAGGVGAPPLCFFAARLAPTLHANEQLLILVGARRRDLLVGVDEFRALGATVRVATDDGSHGYQGSVTDLLQHALEEPIESAVYACGPNRMLQGVAQACLARGTPCQVSLDAPMPCGIGVCLGCAVKVVAPNGGVWYKRACVEGPVFWAEEVVWE
jgi:dihydroorotate dehydrogenase electron transfer subunit